MALLPDAPPARRVMTDDGVALATYEWGDPDAPLVLAVHGFASSAIANWHVTGWTRELTRSGFRVLAIDQRGHGASSKPHDPAAYSMERLVADVITVLDAHLVDEFALLGYSLGARVGWHTAIELPDRLTRAVLGGIPDGDPLTRFLVEEARTFVAGGPRSDDRLTMAYLDMAGRIDGNDLGALVSLVEGMRGGTQPDPANPPQQPLLLATGTEDPILEASRRLSLAAPHAEFLQIPDRNHFNAPTSKVFRTSGVAFLHAGCGGLAAGGAADDAGCEVQWNGLCTLRRRGRIGLPLPPRPPTSGAAVTREIVGAEHGAERGTAPGLGSRLLDLRIRGRIVPATLVLLVGYVIARAFSTGLLAVFWAAFPTGPWSTAYFHGGSDFLAYLASWDTRWYEQIALHGYPAPLPLDAAGDVTYNTWAFFPVFPAITRGLMDVTGLGFESAGIVVAVVFGAGATLALHRVLLVRFRPTQALWGALLFAFGPLSFLLQVAYAESTFLFFLFLALWFMQRRRYLAMIPFALIASFAHPGTLALAAALAAQGLHRLWRRHPIPHREWITGVVAIAVIVAATLLWPVLASAATGTPNAYFETELAWWRAYFGPVIFVPFSPFFLLWGHLWGVLGIAIVVVVAIGVIVAMTRRAMRAYGADLWTFFASWIGYLFAVFLPTQSLFRMLLPLAPMLGHPALSRTRRRRLISFAVSIALQPATVYLLWVVYPP